MVDALGLPLIFEITEGQRHDIQPAKGLLCQAASRLTGLSRDALLHDDLGDEYHPAWFHEFADHSARHGLQYLGDAEFVRTLRARFGEA